ncbi:MAG: YbaN family protein [Actinobacteria bacterium]|nr:YbaN family protein [Actinomycetota bacterium]
MKKPVRVLLISTGTLCIGVGIAGIFIPVLPTTPFILLAAALYAKSSRKFYSWLVNNRVFGSYIRSYREKRGVPLKIKVYALSVLWLTIGLSIYFGTQIIWLRLLLVAVAAGVSVHILKLKTIKNT